MTTTLDLDPLPGIADTRSQLRLVIAGSVDDGKSTLVGRLLYDTKSILADQYEAIEEASRRRGSDDVDLALLTDGLRAEREQGITIDVAYRYFSTPRRSFVLADTPGHTQYTRNTVTGASTAQAAVVLVDARQGVLAQTRRHLAVLALLRVPHVIVAVNKMDLVGWDRGRFDEVAADVAAAAGALGMGDVRSLPVSALTGQNVTPEAGRAGAADPAGAWYEGPSLLEAVEALDVSRDEEWAPFRLPVQLVVRPRTAEHPDYRGLAGRVAAGQLRVGDRVTAWPSGLNSEVVGIDTPAGPAVTARAGESVTVLLADEIDAGRGQVLAAQGGPAPLVTTRLEGTACWLAERPSAPRQRVLVKVGTATVRGLLDPVGDIWDVDAQRWAPGPSTGAGMNDIARLSVTLAEPVAVDAYAESRWTGGALVIDPDSGATVAALMVGSAAATP